MRMREELEGDLARGLDPKAVRKQFATQRLGTHSYATMGSPCGAGSRCAQYSGATPTPETQWTVRPQDVQ